MRPPTATTPKDSVVWKRYAEASPLQHVSGEYPPTLLIHGDADKVVDPQQSVAFEMALKKLGVATRLVSVPGGDHGSAFGLQPNAGRPANWPDYLAETVRWFDQHLASTGRSDR